MNREDLGRICCTVRYVDTIDRTDLNKALDEYLSQHGRAIAETTQNKTGAGVTLKSRFTDRKGVKFQISTTWVRGTPMTYIDP